MKSINPKISIVVPAYNEGEVIAAFLQKLLKVVEENDWDAEVPGC
jgi:glycosyltransferase involved in cell wall biosynthesis